MFKALLLLLLLQFPAAERFVTQEVPGFHRSASVPEMGAWGRRRSSFFGIGRSRSRMPTTKADWAFTLVLVLFFLLFGGFKSRSSEFR